MAASKRIKVQRHSAATSPRTSCWEAASRKRTLSCRNSSVSLSKPMEASVATEAAQPTDGVRWLFYKGDIDVPSKAVEIFMRWTNLWKKSLENMQCRAPAMTGPRWFLLLTATRTFWKILNYCCTMHQQAIWAKVMGLILLWCLWLKSATFVQRQSSAGASSSSWRKVLQNLLSSSFTLTSGGVRYYSAGWSEKNNHLDEEQQFKAKKKRYSTWFSMAQRY